MSSRRRTWSDHTREQQERLIAEKGRRDRPSKGYRLAWDAQDSFRPTACDVCRKPITAGQELYAYARHFCCVKVDERAALRAQLASIVVQSAPLPTLPKAQGWRLFTGLPVKYGCDLELLLDLWHAGHFEVLVVAPFWGIGTAYARPTSPQGIKHIVAVHVRAETLRMLEKV